MENNQLDQLTKKAEQIKRTQEKQLTKLEKKLYFEYRDKILNKDIIDHWIAQTIAEGKTELWVFKEKFTNGINIENLIEIPCGDHDKSILDELREMYPSPIKCYGKNTTGDWCKAHDIYYYTEYYVIKMKWGKKKASCNLL